MNGGERHSRIDLHYFLLFQTFRGVVVGAGSQHPVNEAAGVRGGQFIARLRALLARTVVDQGIRTLSE